MALIGYWLLFNYLIKTIPTMNKTIPTMNKTIPTMNNTINNIDDLISQLQEWKKEGFKLSESRKTGSFVSSRPDRQEIDLTITLNNNEYY